jgi:hypothetical protein
MKRHIESVLSSRSESRPRASYRSRPVHNRLIHPLAAAHGVPRYMVRDRASQRVAEDAGGAEMDAADDTNVSDFCNSARETGERTSPRTRFGDDGEGGVVPENGGEDERHRAADRGVG